MLLFTTQIFCAKEYHINLLLKFKIKAKVFLNTKYFN